MGLHEVINEVEVVEVEEVVEYLYVYITEHSLEVLLQLLLHELVDLVDLVYDELLMSEEVEVLDELVV